MIYSSTDLSWLKEAGFPFVLNGGEITVRVRFRMSYNSNTREYSINPDNAKILDKSWTYHGDEYAIRIRWPYNQAYPDCYESGTKKIVNHAKKIHCALADVHMNSDGSLCLAPPQDLHMSFSQGFSLEIFMETYLIPYLFSQTHFRKTGDWPWLPAGHGALGPLEWYWKYKGGDVVTATRLTARHLVRSGGLSEGKVRELLKRRYRGRESCLSHIDTRMQDCCPEALNGLNKLISNKHMLTLSRGFSD